VYFDDLYLYETGPRRWTQMAAAGQAPPARAYFGMALTPGGAIYVFAGDRDDGGAERRKEERRRVKG
jgi:hypothetical protein